MAIKQVPKQVIIVRRSFDVNGNIVKPRTGKIIAQACHASLNSYLQAESMYQDCLKDGEYDDFASAFFDWNAGIFKKIVYYIPEEGALGEFKLHELHMKTIHLPCYLVKDEGLIEFAGTKQYTALGIGPVYSKDVDPITGSLPLF